MVANMVFAYSNLPEHCASRKKWNWNGPQQQQQQFEMFEPIAICYNHIGRSWQ